MDKSLVLRPNVQSVIKRLAYTAGTLVVCGYAAMFIGGPQGWSSLKEKWNHIEALEKETADLKQTVETIKKYNSSVQKDPDIQQLEIRKNLEMMRPGELEFRYPKEPETKELEKPAVAPAN